MNSKSLIFLVIFLFPIANAATTGNISQTTTQNSTFIVTGIWGSSYNFYCDNNSSCQPGDKCILDYDSNSANFSGTAYKGWCVSSGESSCRHENTFFASGSKRCDVEARSCSNGVWTSTACASNQTCSSGECVASSSSSSSSGSSGTPSPTTSQTTATTTQVSLVLKISSVPPDFNITQGSSALKEVTVQNTGNNTASGVSLSISGVDWYTITPSSVNISKSSSSTFTINFVVPIDADVKEYTVTATASNGTETVSSTFKLRVLPSSETVEKVIIPLYDEYLSLLNQLENNITELRSKGADVTDLNNILNSIREKLSQASSSMNDQDYFTANVLLEDAKRLLDDLQVKITNTVPPQFNILFIIIPAAIGLVAVLAYLFWPVGPAKQPGK